MRYVGNHTSRFKEGDLILLGSDLPHVWLNDKSNMENEDLNKKSRALVIHFSKNFLSNVFQNSAELKPLTKLFQLAERGISFPERISKKATSMMFDVQQKTGLQQWIAVLKLLDLLLACQDYALLATTEYHPKLTVKDKDIISKVLDYVRNNIEDKIELDDVADIACLSKHAFCRYFKKKTTKSFFTFLNDYKIENAKRMLHENSSLSIGTIAIKSGFPSVQHFNAKFKALNGITPSEYRNKWNI